MLVFIVFAGSALSLLTQPIQQIDSDIWIHLSDGRYLFQYGHIPSHSFFSFLEPPRVMPNYRWLFQALVYQLYQCSGYYGLILLRSACYMITVAIILRYLWRGQAQSATGWSLVGFSLAYCLFMPQRYWSVRPHMFTYLSIALFLYVFEFHPRRAILLVPVAVLWCNLHGVAYPILLAICGAYVLEHVLGRLRGQPPDPAIERDSIAPIILCVLAVYLTPSGLALLTTPFRNLKFLSLRVHELMPQGPDSLGTLHLDGFALSIQGIFTLFLLASIMAAWSVSVKRQVRLSALVLYLVGFVLLWKANRFMFEFMLLALPLLRAWLSLPVEQGTGASAHRPWALVGLLIAVTFSSARDVWGIGHGGTYPLSHSALPQGISAFLNRVDVGGKVWNVQNTGGYLRWMIRPSYRILMDVDSTFRDDDFYVSEHALTDPVILGRVLARYDPSFLCVPREHPSFGTVIAPFPQFVPVFFDEVEVLYANRQHHPQLAAQYELRVLNPFQDDQQDEHWLRTVDPDQVLEESRRLLNIYPQSRRLNTLVAMILSERGAPAEALPFAHTVVDQYPEFPESFILNGELLERTSALRAALACYRTALKKTDPSRRSSLYMRIGRVYAKLGPPRTAYRYLSRGIDVFASGTPVNQLFLLGMTAAQAQRPTQAEAIFTYLLEFKIPPEDTQQRQAIEAVQAQFHLARSRKD